MRYPISVVAAALLALSCVPVPAHAALLGGSANVSEPAELSATLDHGVLRQATPVFQDWQRLTPAASNILIPDSDAVSASTEASIGAITNAASFPSDPFTTSTASTANSPTFTYSADSPGLGHELYLSANSAPDTFDHSNPMMPEPAMIAFLAAGLAGLAVAAACRT